MWFKEAAADGPECGGYIYIYTYVCVCLRVRVYLHESF